VSTVAWPFNNVRHVFVSDDTAQIVVDWPIDGKGPHGEAHMRRASAPCRVIHDRNRPGTGPRLLPRQSRWEKLIDASGIRDTIIRSTKFLESPAKEFGR